MRRLLRVAGIAAGALVLTLLAIWLLSHLFTRSSLWARTIAWMDSDVLDYRRFPSRTVGNAPPVFEFGLPTAEEQAQFASALSEVTFMERGRDTTRELIPFLERTNTVAFLVIKDDVLLLERYFHGYSRESTVTSFSTAKSFVSALVGVAVGEGRIGSVEDYISYYVPELLAGYPAFGSVTLRHLLTMSSGIRYVETGMPWGDDAATYYAPDLRAVALSARLEGAPGQLFHYNNYHPLLLGLVLERVTGMSVAAYLQEKIWEPLGMEAPATWSLDSVESGFEKMESGLNGRAIDFAKFGRLYLNRGSWDGRQIVPADWVDVSTRRDTRTDPAANYQYFWWVDPETPEHFLAAGKHGQYIYVAPEAGVVLVRFGRTDPFGRWREVFRDLTARLVRADTK